MNKDTNMNKVIKVSIFVFILIFFSHDLFAADILFNMDFSSRYIWRGFDLNPYRKPVIQPSLDWKIGQSGLSINIWSSLSFVSKEFNEVDLTLSYGKELTKGLLMETGLIHYAWYFTEDFEFKDDTSHEFFVSLGFPKIFFSPSLVFFYDFTVGDGFYTQLDIGYSLEVQKSFSAGLHSSLGYNGGQWLAEGVDAGFSDLNFSSSLVWDVGRLSLGASAHWTIVLLDAIGQENHFWFKISLSLNVKGRE